MHDRTRTATAFALMVCVVGVACGDAASPPVAATPLVPRATYLNPVLDADFPDPAILRTGDGWFHAWATQTVRGGRQVNIQAARSRDLVAWEWRGDALPVRPAWSTRVWHFWAPHVVRDSAAGRYLMYYSAEHDAGGKCLAIATATSPDGPFTDMGTPLTCGAGGFDIDPMAFTDPVTGRHYLYWGSSTTEPIRVRELAADRMGFAPGSRPVDVIAPGQDVEYDRLVEGAWAIHRDGWYYLFYSGDDCCGAVPHYAVMVARARDPLGPFERLGAVAGTRRSEILATGVYFRAPGHNAVVTDDAGTHWIAYHAVDPARPLQDEAAFVRRPMLLDPLQWVAGWPRVALDGPSSWRVERPVIDTMRR